MFNLRSSYKGRKVSFCKNQVLREARYAGKDTGIANETVFEPENDESANLITTIVTRPTR